MDLEALREEVLRRKRSQVRLLKGVNRVCSGLCIPLGESLLGGPSSNVGGDRKALVSDAGRPRGEGPYGDLSPGREGGSECRSVSTHSVGSLKHTVTCTMCVWCGSVPPLNGSGLARLSRVYGSLSRESSFSWVSVSLEAKPPDVSV